MVRFSQKVRSAYSFNSTLRNSAIRKIHPIVLPPIPEPGTVIPDNELYEDDPEKYTQNNSNIGTYWRFKEGGPLLVLEYRPAGTEPFQEVTTFQAVPAT